MGGRFAWHYRRGRAGKRRSFWRRNKRPCRKRGSLRRKRETQGFFCQTMPVWLSQFDFQEKKLRGACGHVSVRERRCKGNSGNRKKPRNISQRKASFGVSERRQYF